MHETLFYDIGTRKNWQNVTFFHLETSRDYNLHQGNMSSVAYERQKFISPEGTKNFILNSKPIIRPSALG